MLDEILRESPGFQEMTRWAREEGLEEGRKEGLEEGEIKASRQLFLLMIDKRFPALSPLATELSMLIDDVPVLQELAVNVSGLQSQEEAEVLLINEIRQRKQ